MSRTWSDRGLCTEFIVHSYPPKCPSRMLPPASACYGWLSSHCLSFRYIAYSYAVSTPHRSLDLKHTTNRPNSVWTDCRVSLPAQRRPRPLLCHRHAHVPRSCSPPTLPLIIPPSSGCWLTRQRLCIYRILLLLSSPSSSPSSPIRSWRPVRAPLTHTYAPRHAHRPPSQADLVCTLADLPSITTHPPIDAMPPSHSPG
jgi:hypothetical protein